MPRAETVPIPPASATTTQIDVGTVSTELLNTDAARRGALIQVLSGGPVFVRTGTAATTDDFPVPDGAVFEYDGLAALNAIVASGTADVRIWEEVNW